MFLNIDIYFIILKTYDQQFTSTTKKSLHIVFNNSHSCQTSATSLSHHRWITRRSARNDQL